METQQFLPSSETGGHIRSMSRYVPDILRDETAVSEET